MSSGLHAWWSFRFKMIWPEGQEAKWWVDLCILDTCVRQVLDELHGEVSLWRVHRRAARDDGGHRFTLFLYCNEATARRGDQQLQASRALTNLRQGGLVAEYSFEEVPERRAGKRISDTSDPVWPVTIQASWPYFIMGGSRMLLELMGEVKPELEGEVSSDLAVPMAEVEEYYLRVKGAIADIWKAHGSHAFFHHINALFGYDPLVIQPRSLWGFLGTV